MRRRDGIALAATGAIPARVRAQVLAEHRAELTARARAAVIARLDAGLLPLPIPYGYRRYDSHPGDLPAAAAGYSRSDYATLSSSDPYGPVQRRLGEPGRCGRAPALDWSIDEDCADAIRMMTYWIRSGSTPAQVAARLNTDRRHPVLLTPSGRPRRWTAATVTSVLTDPALIGHGVWGRTHHGRPRPRPDWTLSTTPTHPPILDTSTYNRTRETLATAPVDASETPGTPGASGMWGSQGLRRRR